MLAALDTGSTVWAALADGLNWQTPTGLMLFLLSIFGIAILRRKSVRTPTSRDYTREAAARIREQHGVKEDLETLMVQLSELARQLNGQMDTRYAKMEQALAEADRKIATLEALLRRASGGQNVDVIVGDQGVEPAAKPVNGGPAGKTNKSRKASKQAKRPEKTERRAEKAEGLVSGATGAPGKEASIQQERPASAEAGSAAEMPGSAEQRQSSAARLQAPQAEPLTAAVTGSQTNAPGSKVTDKTGTVDSRYGRIYSLADQGHSVVEIARQTGQTTGEVELILNLRKSQVR